MHAHVVEGACAHVCGACGGQRSMALVFLNHSIHHFSFEASFLTESATLWFMETAWPQNPRDPLSLALYARPVSTPFWLTLSRFWFSTPNPHASAPSTLPTECLSSPDSVWFLSQHGNPSLSASQPCRVRGWSTVEKQTHVFQVDLLMHSLFLLNLAWLYCLGKVT